MTTRCIQQREKNRKKIWDQVDSGLTGLSPSESKKILKKNKKNQPD